MNHTGNVIPGESNVVFSLFVCGWWGSGHSGYQGSRYVIIWHLILRVGKGAMGGEGGLYIFDLSLFSLLKI